MIQSILTNENIPLCHQVIVSYDSDEDYAKKLPIFNCATGLCVPEEWICRNRTCSVPIPLSESVTMFTMNLFNYLSVA